MTGPTIRVAAYFFRASFTRRRRTYLALVLIVGLLGGLSLASLAGARRTQASYPYYLASTHPSDLSYLAGIYNPTTSSSRAYFSGYDARLISTVNHLPGVKSSASYVGLNAGLLQKDGSARTLGSALIEGSLGAEFFRQDRVTVVEGRMSNPSRANEVVVSQDFARAAWGNHPLPTVAIPVGFYTNAQFASPLFGTSRLRPRFRLDIKVVGVVKFNDTVVQDQVDASPFGRVLLTPALTHQVLNCCATDTATYVKLTNDSDLAAVEAGIVRELPSGATPLFQFTSTFETQTLQTIKPISIALGVFGGIAGLVTLLLAALLIARQLQAGEEERRTFRALGASPSMIVSDFLFGVVGAVVLGSLLSIVVALLMSPIAPLGPVRPFYPSPGLAFDGLVMVLGATTWIVTLCVVAYLLAYATTRPRRHRRPGAGSASRVGFASAASVLPPPAFIGIRFALVSRAGSVTAPVRSAIAGVAIAVTVVFGTLTFGASLDSLVSHPRLYGWNWDYQISSNGFGYSDIPQSAITRLLNHDRFVRSWTGVYFAELQIDGQTVPVIGTTPNASVGPPTISGRRLTAPGQIVLGAATLTQLHKRLGDVVSVSDGGADLVSLRVVGTATLPTVGQAGSLHTTMGSGALLSAQLIPPAVRNPFHTPITGPQAIWIRVRANESSAALASLRRIIQSPKITSYGAPTLSSVQRPAQIVNYRSMGTTPALLGVGLAAGAVAALGLTLVASVRRRRHDLAVLKTLGFTKRQLATTVAWQASMSVAVGTIIGAPVGIILGSHLWNLFARSIHVVPEPSVPVQSLVLVVVGELLLANAVAIIPGRDAARTPTALVLKAP